MVSFGVAGAGDIDIPAWAANAERAGFDVLGVGEHLFFNVPTTNSFVALSAAAAVTSRIQLMSSIALLPLYPAALVAKLATALDQLSGGRFHLGIGIGGENPSEFTAVGVPVEERGARASEALEVIRRLWTEDEVVHDGRFTQLDGVTLRPKPVAPGGPPVWVAGRSDAAIRRAARLGDGWLPYMYTPEMIARDLEVYREELVAAGRSPDSARVGMTVFTAVDDDEGRGYRTVLETLERNYAQPFADLVPKYTLYGSPQRCLERVGEYLDAGVDTIMFTSAGPPEARSEHEARIADEIVAALREDRPQPDAEDRNDLGP